LELSVVSPILAQEVSTAARDEHGEGAGAADDSPPEPRDRGVNGDRTFSPRTRLATQWIRRRV
jgi:hypothetical protein